MRPLKLTVNAFGPYANTQIFDFQALAGQNLFLITGDIGAGKTTIFDAICCALYGETSGGERTVEEMRSHHALADRCTEITLEFSIQGDLFRAWFSPKQTIPKKRGSGFTEQLVQSALYQIDFVEQPSKDATLLSESISKTRVEIEALIGFNVNQFRQVVMLAQGKFRELLNANSTDREEILKTLVDTEFLSRFEKKLKTLEINLKQTVTDLESQIKGLLKSENIENFDALLPLRREIEKECILADKKTASAESIRLNTEQKLNQAISLNKLFDQYQLLIIEHQSLAEQKDEIATLTSIITQHTEAEKLWSDLCLYEEANKMLLAAQTELSDKQNQYDTLLKIAKKTVQKLTVQQTEKPIQEQRKIDLQSLTQVNAALSSLTIDRQNHQQATELFNSSKNSVLFAEETIKNNNQQLEKLEKDLALLIQSDTALVEIKYQLDNKQSQLKHFKRIEEKRKIKHDVEKIADDLQHQSTQQASQVKSVNLKLQQLEKSQKQELASYLASQLKDEHPCTVCGSQNHPFPAPPPEHVPSDEQIKSAKKGLHEQENKLNKIQVESEKTQLKLAGIDSVLNELLSASPEEESTIQECEKEMLAITQQHKIISQQVKHKVDLTQQQLVIKQTLKKANEESIKYHSEFNHNQSKVNTLEGQIKNQLKAIPQQYQNKENLNTEINELEKLIVQFDTVLNDLSLAHQKAQKTVDTSNGALDSVKVQQQKFITDFKNKEIIINKVIAASSFTNVDRLKSAKLSEHEALTKKQQIEHYKKKSLHVETQLNDLRSQLQNKTQPDLSTLEANSQLAQSKKNDCLKLKGKLDERLAVIDALIHKVTKEKDNLTKATEEYERTSHLSKIANGSGYQGSRLSFSRYLLGRLLDEILLASSSRLNIMSEGRYQLTRKIDQSNKKSAFGLDIEIIDAYTGKKRSVNTFSGGEGFLASLSLALGLSEVVQNNAGGIQLDTLFIDEGFGSLNDDALEQAINVLTTLSGDGRLVGVISHVNELKERIEAQLVVTKTAKGSFAKFVL